MQERAQARRAAGRAVRARWRPSSACPSARSCAYRPRSQRDERRGAARRARRAPRRRPPARLHRARPAPRRAAARARAAGRCARSARRASSASACSRCCSPSARCCSSCAAAPPLMLLDDVMSELDAERRAAPGRAAARRRPGADHGHRAPSTCRAPARPGVVDDPRRARRAGGDGMSRRAPRRRSPTCSATPSPTPRRTPSWRASRRLWPEVAGAAIAAESAPASEREGTVTVECSGAVWAQELTLLAPDLVGRLNARSGGRPRCARLRFVVKASVTSGNLRSHKSADLQGFRGVAERAFPRVRLLPLVT